MNHDITLRENLPPEEPEQRLQQLAERATQAHDNFRASMQRAVAYAWHLLQPLERIHDGLAGYQWHWDGLGTTKV